MTLAVEHNVEQKISKHTLQSPGRDIELFSCHFYLISHSNKLASRYRKIACHYHMMESLYHKILSCSHK